MNIGEESPAIVIEPIEEPKETPAPTPKKEPVPA